MYINIPPFHKRLVFIASTAYMTELGCQQSVPSLRASLRRYEEEMWILDISRKDTKRDIV